MLTTTLLRVGLVPLIVAAIVSLIMRRMHSPPQYIWPVGFACGFLAGQLVIRSEPGLAVALHGFIQPHEAVDWLPLIVLIALGVSVVQMASIPSPFGRGQGEGALRLGDSPSPRPGPDGAPRGRGRVGQWRTIALAAALALAAPVRLLSGNVRLTQQWSAIEKLAYLLLLAATLGLVWLLLASKADGKQTVLRAPLLILVAVGTAIVVTQSGAFVYGLSSGAVAAAVAGTALAFRLYPSGSKLGATGFASAWQRLSFPGIAGAAGVITFSLGSLILLGRFYAYVTAVNATLLFISLAATGAPLPDVLRRGPGWQQVAARMVLCVLPLAIALINAIA